MVSVFVSGGLKTLTGGASRFEVTEFEGGDLRQLVETLAGRFGPAFSERLRSGEELRKYVNVFVNGEDVRFHSGLRTPVAQGDTVDFIPAVAGG